MPIASILKLGPLDADTGLPVRRFTNQELADLALEADQRARRSGDLVQRMDAAAERDALCQLLA